MIAFLRRIRESWRRSGELRDQQWAEEKLAQREAERRVADESLPVSRTNSDWTYIPPPG